MVIKTRSTKIRVMAMLMAIFIFVGVVPINSLAETPEKVTINFTVTDKEGQPAENATGTGLISTTKYVDELPIEGLKTDENGKATYDVVDPGWIELLTEAGTNTCTTNVSVTFEKDGYTGTSNYSVNEDNPATEIPMAVQMSEEKLETVTIFVSDKDSNAPISGIEVSYATSEDDTIWNTNTDTTDEYGNIKLSIPSSVITSGNLKLKYSIEETSFYKKYEEKIASINPENLLVCVELESKTFTVSMKAIPENGSVKLNGQTLSTQPVTVKAGSEVVIEALPNKNYNRTEFDIEGTAGVWDEDSNTVYKIDAITENVTLKKVVFSKLTPVQKKFVLNPVVEDELVATRTILDGSDIYIFSKSSQAKYTIKPSEPNTYVNAQNKKKNWSTKLSGSITNAIEDIYYTNESSYGYGTAQAYEQYLPIVVVDNTSPTITPSESALYGNSSTGVTVSLKATDTGLNNTYSGFGEDFIKEAYYTQDGVYEPETEDLVKNDLISSLGIIESSTNEDNESLTLRDVTFNEVGKYTLYVLLEDRAGNQCERQFRIVIDDTKPIVEVTFEPSSDTYLFNSVVCGTAGTDKVTATIKITDKYFDSDKATETVSLSAMVKGVALDSTELPTLSSWSDEGDTHTATLTFSKQAKYSLEFSGYENLCGNGADSYSKDFIFDTEAPTGQLKISDKNTEKPEGETIFEIIFNAIGNFFKDIFGISEDETLVAEVLTGESNLSDNVSSSGAIEISYYVANDLSKDYMLSTGNTAPENTVFIDEETWTTDKPILDADGKYIVFARIKDEAGNITYLDSQGIVVDTTPPAPDGEVTAPVITVKPDQEKDYYNGNVNLDVSVIDPIVNDVYSGISSISYEIYNMGEQTESNETYFKYDGDLSKDSVIQAYNENINGYKQIEVNASDNNSNDVAIVVTAIDNAGNVSEAFEKIIAIDTKTPVINVSYENNSATNGKYYNETRVATVTVTERNFDPDNTVITIKNSDGVMPTISDWKMTKDGTGNKDDREYSATITYSADGDYTFDIKAKDLAGNEATEITYEGSNPTEFTIDKTLPVVSVAYNNNNASNQKYFNAIRTATVTVKEHNFDVDRVEFTQTAKFNGSSIGIPTATWTHNGDTHTATIKYTADGDYTFDVAMTDAANNKAAAANYGSSVAGKEFTIDTKIENPVITGVSNGVAYKDEVVPVITIDDVNLADVDIELIRSVKGKTENVTAQFIKNATFGDQGGSVTNDTFEKIQDNDGIYTLTVKMTDKAGNTSSESVRFTVNRFGSVYELGDYTKDLQNSSVQKVTKKLVITEYNPSQLEEGSLKIKVTRDGNPIKNLKFTTSPTVNNLAAPGESGWYQYEYALDPANFAEDGVYTIIISSKDIAGNTPETTNYDDCEMTFSVDTVAPEFTSIKGLEKAIVNASKLDVEFEVFDAIGIAKVEVYVDGEKVAVFEKEKIDDVINFVSQFTIGEGTKQKVQLVAYDFAGNKADTDLFGTKDADGNVIDPGYKFNKTVTVSTNFFVRWYANKPLFWGTIALIVAGSTGIIVAAKKKKDDDEEENK